MSMMYVAPEQQMKDRADFARKGIARGRSVVVLRYAEGICFVAENRSQSLHKVSEIYDRIGFAAVGRYNEFENLRIAGIRHADLRGYSYDRADVTGRGLANAYAQLLGTIFSAGGEKPYEVEIVVAEIGSDPDHDQIYRLTYDGSVGDEQHFAVMGGQAESIATALEQGFTDGMSLGEAVGLAVRSLSSGRSGETGELAVDALEIAVLDRKRSQPRKFRRIRSAEIAELLASVGSADAATPAGTTAAEAADPPAVGADEVPDAPTGAEAVTGLTAAPTDPAPTATDETAGDASAASDGTDESGEPDPPTTP